MNPDLAAYNELHTEAHIHKTYVKYKTGVHYGGKGRYSKRRISQKRDISCYFFFISLHNNARK
jgi:hypothetical protein